MELCDDGNTTDGNGCLALCEGVFKGWNCTERLENGTNNCIEICGDGISVGKEDCDDGKNDIEGCKDTCVGIRKGWKCTLGSYD